MTSVYQSSSFGKYSQEGPYRQKERKQPTNSESSGQYVFRNAKQRSTKKNAWNFGNESNTSMVYSDKTSTSDLRTKRSRYSESNYPFGSDFASVKDSMKDKTPGWIQIDKESEVSSWKAKEEEKKFSNRYLYETNTCGRYDLIVDYFRDMPVMTDTIKTPAVLAKSVISKPSAQKKSTLVQEIGMSRRMAPSEIEKMDNEAKEKIVQRTCNKDGTPWLPNFNTERSELSWFRRHFKANEPIVPPRKTNQTCVKVTLGNKAPSSKETNKFHPIGYSK